MIICYLVGVRKKRSRRISTHHLSCRKETHSPPPGRLGILNQDTFQNHRCVRIVAGLHSLEYILGPYLDVNSLCKVPQVRDKMCNYHLVIHARSEVRMAKIPKPTVTFGHAHLSSQNHMIVRFVLCCPD